MVASEMSFAALERDAALLGFLVVAVFGGGEVMEIKVVGTVGIFEFATTSNSCAGGILYKGGATPRGLPAFRGPIGLGVLQLSLIAVHLSSQIRQPWFPDGGAVL